MRSIRTQGRDRLRLLGSSLVLLSAFAITAVVGCGGGGGTGAAGGGGGAANNKVLSGTNLNIGVGVTIAKSTDVAIVPFSVLNSVNPGAGPGFPVTRSSAPTFVPGLNLYSASTITGKVLTTSFYSDAAGKNSAGKLTVVSTEPIGSAYTYPVSFHATGAISGGSIPLSADFSIVFSDSHGANTLKGTLTLSKDNIAMILNMSLDDAGKVGSSGSIKSTYSYNYQGTPIPVSTTLTNLTGSPTTTIHGDASVDATVPVFGDQKGTGAGVLDLINGTFTLNVTAGPLQGFLADFNRGNDTLTVNTGSGFSDVVNGASGFNLGTLLKTTTSSGAGYQAPSTVQGSGRVNVEQTLGDGEMVGFSLDPSNKTTGYYWPNPTAVPQELPAPTGGSHTSAHGIATYSGQTVVVGSYSSSSGTIQPCFWIDTSGSHVFQPYTASGTLPYGGEFEGISANGNTIVGFSYSQTFVKSPIAYISGSLYNLPGDGRHSNLMALAVDNSNDILGAGDGLSPYPGIWSNASVDPSTSQITAKFVALPEFNGLNTTVQAVHISDNGVVVGGDGQIGLYWQKSEGFAPHPLPMGSNAGATGYAVNHAGTQAAGSLYAVSPSTTTDLSFWSTLKASPVNVSLKLGSAASGYPNLSGFFILDDGSLIAMGTTTSSTNLQFFYIQKK